MATLAWDFLDRRILAAIRFVDVLGNTVTCPQAISAPDGVRWFVKRPGVVIVTEAPGFEAYAASFAAPPAAGAASLPIDVRPADPAYAPRRFVLALPRGATPADQNSVFDPLNVVLTPGDAARPDGLAAGLIVTVTRKTDGAAIEGALVRLKPDGGKPATNSLTNAAGEALLLAGAIPIATPGPGAVMLRDFAATVDAVIDPARIRIHAPGEVFAARQAAALRTRDFIDPDALSVAATPTASLRIAAGQVRTASIQWTPP